MSALARTVVVIDDDEPIRRYLRDVLSLEGYECKCFQESLAALSYMTKADKPPDLVLTDFRMPGMDGLEVLRRIHAVSPDVPVVLMSGVYELGMALEAVDAGAADYLFKPARPAEVLSMVALHIRIAAKPDIDAVQTALAAFLSQYDPLNPQQAASPEQVEQTMKLFQALGSKRYETMQHCTRVAAYSTLFGRAAGLGESELHALQLGALLHDIGKVAIPRNVLLKPAPLDEREWSVMRTHPRIGFELLSGLPGFKDAADIVHCHHERYDGTGYPRGLCALDIPLGARMFSIVDTVDAVTSNRPYRRAGDFETAAAELRNGSGTKFDRELVNRFLAIPRQKFLSVRDRFPDTE